ncbi:cadherin-like beta sandwich domain-containing protein [Paenibacillus mesotrionivorans]|uniref:Cadherin-like beta sandwich domain-containing protein n=1 Tax=Paenibacillus mesotrionivorans TaxID=3160968 RepID=A0ACC7NT38_9BACL
MNSEKLLTNVSRMLAVIMLFSLLAFAPVPASASQAGQTDGGSSVTQAVYNSVSTSVYAAVYAEEDPYFRLDPGPGQMPVKVTEPTNVWAARTPLDNRVPADFAGGTFKMIPYPFADSKGKGDVLQINYAHNGKSTFGGISLESPLSPAVNIPAGSTIEFDVYYPKSAQGKFMRWRIRAGSSTVDAYLRDYQYNNLNPDWVGSYNSETWLKAHHSITASTGSSSSFVLELHGENARPVETGMLLVANIQISTPDPNGIPLPNVVNKENQSAVAPLKSLYNRENGLFMVGAIGTGTVTGARANHYEIFVDGNNLKADGTHPRGPSWLKNAAGEPMNGAATTPGLAEYSFPTGSYQAIRDSGTPGQYKSHGHVLAWYNQAPGWMTQIIPANLPSGYTGTTKFYGLGNGVTTTVKVDKEMARRVQFNHTMYVMRHFLTTDAKYGSSVSRGIIPFNSWDVLNEEVHESRHSELIPTDANNWRNSLKHTNWLAAMSDNRIDGDVKDHYIYLLFKNAHIAAPNARMAAAYKANYENLPEYMKLDGHDTDGSIDAYIVDTPPKLTYNDYGLASRSKARTVYNMVLELNTAWLSDPLYDGRPLIEDIGIQGHDAVGKTLASDNQYAMALYASLVDRGLLSGISYSELDLKIPTDAPGGGATAPAVLNVKQSDALGYEYALLYKLFTKFAPYIDHIISWGVAGSGWQGSYVLFDGQNNANAGYYGAMDPDRFIQGHSYLDSFFEGEYGKLQNSYGIDLGDLGIYTPANTIADLSGLTLSAGTLDPAFDAATTEYEVALKDAASIQVTPEAKNSKATIKINGTAVESGTASAVIDTPAGETLITVKVTAQNGSTEKIYTIKVTNTKTPAPVKSSNANLSGLTLSAGTLDPAFAAATIQYSVSLQDSTGVKVTATAADNKATIKMDGTVVPSSTASGTISLTPGAATDVKVEVTAEDGTVKIYTIKVTNGKTDSPSSSDSETSSSPTPTPAASVVSGQKVTVKTTVENGIVSVAAPDLEKVKEFLAKNVTLEIPAAQGVNAYAVGLPAAALISGTKEHKLTLSTELGKVVIPGNLLAGTTASSGKEVALKIGKGDKSKLAPEVKAALGDRPVIQLTLAVDGKETAWSNPSAPVTVSVPYKPTADELKNPEMIVVWSMDGNGNVTTIPSGRYDSKTGMVTFKTTHFNGYAVAYVSKTFTDLGTVAWAKSAVEVLASKDILKTEGSVFHPAADITRADFLYSLVRALGLTAKTNGNFSDVQENAYYYQEVAIAKALGITNGIDNDKFGSDIKITRQDMMVLTERALKLEKKLNQQGAAADLEKFADKSEVASYAVSSVAAMIKEGLIEGGDNKVNPTGNTTRAEAAVILYRLYNK